MHIAGLTKLGSCMVPIFCRGNRVSESIEVWSRPSEKCRDTKRTLQFLGVWLPSFPGLLWNNPMFYFKFPFLAQVSWSSFLIYVTKRSLAKVPLPYMDMWQFSVEILVIILELEGHNTLLELARAAGIISSLPLFCKWINQTQKDEMPFQRSFS